MYKCRAVRLGCGQMTHPHPPPAVLDGHRHPQVGHLGAPPHLQEVVRLYIATEEIQKESKNGAEQNCNCERENKALNIRWAVKRNNVRFVK